MELRPTDVDEALARNRYRTFKELTYEALTSLRRHFHYHFINADAPLQEVERSINAEFQYQSSLELGQATFDIIHGIPLASELTLHARQELVRRLDSYEHASAPLFKEVAAFIEAHVVPVIVRHALAGRCVVKTDSALFEDATAVDMVLDILAERGYHAVYQEQRTPGSPALRSANRDHHLSGPHPAHLRDPLSPARDPTRAIAGASGPCRSARRRNRVVAAHDRRRPRDKSIRARLLARLKRAPHQIEGVRSNNVRIVARQCLDAGHSSDGRRSWLRSSAAWSRSFSRTSAVPRRPRRRPVPPLTACCRR